MTIAEQFAAKLGDDGRQWETADGDRFEDVAASLGARESELDNAWRYRFPDGSAVVTCGEAWDVEGSEPFSWAGCESS